MTDPFASPKRRLARAKEHIDDIEARAQSFSDSKPYARVIERNARGFEEHKVKLTVDLPDRITDIAYEAIEALRSSLDQATYAIAVACNSQRPDLIHFPIADNAADFENILNGRLKDFPPDILALFRAFQPHQSGNTLIWALNRIRRQSTHRLLIPVGTASAGIFIRHMTMTSPHPLDIPPPRWNSEKNEIIFAITGPGSDLQYDVDLAFFIAFGPVEGVAGQPVLATLDAMASEGERIILAME